jgi:ribosomal protein L7Ae-like RNA K-turn-binding protein
MLEVGEEPVESAARARDVRLLLLASDATENTARRVARFSEMGQCLQIRVPFTKEELGKAVGRAGCALLGVTDIGFAAAIARRLADEDAEAYGDAADRLGTKAQRAALRKTEVALHEKNLRRGKKRKPGEVKAAEKPPEAVPSAKPLRQAQGGGKPPAGKSYGRKPYGKPGSPGERKPYGKPGLPGERKPYGRPESPGERKPYGKPGSPGGRKPYGKPGSSGERKPYGKPGSPGERKPYGGPGSPGGRKPYGKPGSPGERKPYGGPGSPGGRKLYGRPGAGARGPKLFAHSRPVKHGKGSFPKKHD